MHAPVLSRIHTHTQPAYDITGDGVVNIADAVKVRRQSQQGSVVSLQRAGDDGHLHLPTLPWLVACLAWWLPSFARSHLTPFAQIISVSNGADTSPDCAADGASVCYEVGVASGLSNCDSTVMDHGSVNCRSAKEVLQIGSSTVFPVANAHSQRYGNPLVAPEARESGSSLGFKAFLAGGTDIATASRALKPSDYAKADCDESLVTAEGASMIAARRRRRSSRGCDGPGPSPCYETVRLPTWQQTHDGRPIY